MVICNLYAIVYSPYNTIAILLLKVKIFFFKTAPKIKKKERRIISIEDIAAFFIKFLLC